MQRLRTSLHSARLRIPGKALGIGALALAVIIGIVVAVQLYNRVQVERDDARRAAREATARDIAQRVHAVIKPDHEALTALAQDPKVVSALSGVDESARQQLGAELKTRIPNALLLRLIPRGMTQTDPNSNPPLTYASLDLLLKSEHQEQATGAEIHLAGTAMEHVALVRRVPPVGDPVGFLHASIDSKVIREAVAAVLTNTSSRIEVRQPVVGGAPIIVASTPGSGNNDIDMATLVVPGTAWVLAVRGENRAAAYEDTGYLNYAAPMLLILLCSWLWLRRRSVVVSPAGATVYSGAIEAILGGQHPGLAQLLPGYDPDARSSSKIAPTPAAPSGDITIAPPPTPAIAAATSESMAPGSIASSIFRSYDIRGVVGETLTPEVVYQIGRAFGSEAVARQQHTVIVARDGRNSSVSLRGALVEGLRDAGCEVLDIGLTPTPVLYFATHYLDARSGVMVTGSHNAAQYNGLKMVLDGETLSGEAIQAIRRRIEEQDFTSGTGGLQEIEIIPDYIRRISEEIPVSLGTALKVVVDCGNSVPGIVAPHILRAIGHDVIELYCEVDGDFPNHHPDPSQPENLEDLIAIVKHEQADLGLAFDGDGDRLGVVDREGHIVWPDRQLMLFAQDVLTRNPGATIIYDVKCSNLLPKVIKKAGGVPLMWKTGHSLIKSKMKETGAPLAGEMSGHIFFKERWYGFDDALYSAARLLEILINANEPPEQVFARLPSGIATPELRLEMAEELHRDFMQQVIDAGGFADGVVSLIDGMRVELAHAWGLIRPSNTSPCLVLRFEGDTDHALNDIKERFRSLLLGLAPNLDLPF